ncbi:hypothetical protein D3C86_1801070 [compost metagenome]
MLVVVLLLALVLLLVVLVLAAVPVVAMGVAVDVLVGQQAVAVFLAAVGQPQVAALADEAAAQAVAVGVVVGTDLLA